jgi:hypothetical protein
MNAQVVMIYEKMKRLPSLLNEAAQYNIESGRKTSRRRSAAGDKL